MKRTLLLSALAALAVSASSCCRCELPGPPSPLPRGEEPDATPGENANPHIAAVFATLDGRRLRVLPPGATVVLESRASDPDDDPLTFRWEAGPGSGTIEAGAPGTAVWRPGRTLGPRRVRLTVSDGRGGTARHEAVIPVDTALTFAGRVLDPEGRPVPGARVAVADRTATTDAAGRFDVRTTRIDDIRYVITVDQPGYGLYSQVFDGGVDGLTLRLVRGTSVRVDPREPISVQDGNASQCTGPLSARVDWTLYPRQREARVFDAAGQPWTGPVPEEVDAALATYARAVPCSPGISVNIPAGGLVDSDGRVPPGPVEITVATADLYAPGGMPGDYTVLAARRYLGIQTFGAGTVTARRGGETLSLAEGVRAEISIPVPPLQLGAEGRQDSEMPFLVYEPSAARWRPIWSATRTPDGSAYVARVDHLSAFNTDLVKVDQSCIRINSAAITGDYTLEATIPIPGAAPSIRSYPIDNTPETLHTLYNLPGSTWVILVPFRQEAAGPVPLGTFVVNTGPPQDPTDPNRPVYPYDACRGQVTLEEVPGETMLVVDGAGIEFGALPVVWYALTQPDGQDIYPLDPVSGALALCGLFDTGSTRLAINDRPPPNAACGPNWGDSDTGHLDLTADATVNVRLNGLAAQNSSGAIPIGPPGSAGAPQLEVQGVSAEPRDIPVTLLGTPVTTAAVAVIDYTTTVLTVSQATGPDITFFEPGAAGIPAADVELSLQRFGLPERFLLTGIVFTNSGGTYQDHDGADPVRFLLDTGTTPTIIGDAAASALGLTAGAGSGACLSGTGNLYEIDAIAMTGAGGTYRVENAVVCWDQQSIAGPYEAVIGSNLFARATIVFDGPGNTLGIIGPGS